MTTPTRSTNTFLAGSPVQFWCVYDYLSHNPNNAEERTIGWKPRMAAGNQKADNRDNDTEYIADANDEDAETDLEQLGHSQIVKLIEANPAIPLTRLTKQLEAQDFSVGKVLKSRWRRYSCETAPWVSDRNESAEVKSGDGMIDRPTVDKLLAP